MLASADEAKVAKIRFESEAHNFGQIAHKGGEVEYDFVFYNDGNIPLVIKKITKNCVCTNVEFSKKPVMPGQKGVVKVKYAPAKLPAGTFHKAIKVFTNDTRGVTILTIHGESVE
jgi:hypothetical protein